MKEEKFETAEWKEIGDTVFRRCLFDEPFGLSFEALQNLETGEIRLEIQIPNAEHISFADDLAGLLRCLGWGIAALGMDARLMKGDWMDCCTVLGKVDSCLRDE